MTTFDALLRASDPAHAVPAYDEDRIARSVADSLERGSGAEVVPLPTSYLRRTGVRVAIAAAVAAAVLILPVVSLRGGGAASPAAAAVLHQAASISATDPVARGDQYWAITTTSRYRNGSQVMDALRVDYVAVDGSRPTWTSQRIEDSAGPTTLDIWTSNVSPTDMPSNWQMPSPAFLASLPRDVDALRARLYADTAGHGRSNDGEVLVYVADVLRTGLVPADLRSALFRVLETVPGVEVTAASVRIGGVEGVAIGRFEDVDGTRQEIVIDPATGQVVAERQIAVQALDVLPAGTVVGQAVVTRSLVDSVPSSIRSAARHDDCTVTSDAGVFCNGGKAG